MSDYITPVMFTDPSGEFVNTIIGGIVGLLIGTFSAILNGDDTGAAALHGLISGALVGLVADVSIAMPGIGGLLIAGTGGLGAGILSNVSQQMIIEGKTFNELDRNEIFITGGITAAVSLATFGLGSALNSAMGTKLSGNLLQKLIQSMKDPASWVFTAVMATSFGMLPGLPSYSD